MLRSHARFALYGELAFCLVFAYVSQPAPGTRAVFAVRAQGIAVDCAMALVRILVDGYSLLHQWPELAPGKPRYSAAARDELIHQLRLYRDSSGTPITVVFDGQSGGQPSTATESTPELEILYSRPGQTADDIIERVASRLAAYGEVLVVTDDFAERDTVMSVGAMILSCVGFIQTIAAARDDLERDIKNYNLRERNQFKRSRRA